MDVNNYKPNSYKYKEEEKERKKVDKVVTSPVKVKKKGELRKLRDVFISEDAGNLKTYVFMDILVPTIKKAISDIVRDGVDMILYGEAGKSSKNRGSNTYVSYRDYSSSERRRDDDRSPRRGREIDDIIIYNRREAEDVLSNLDGIMEAYKVVSVADYYDLLGVTPEYTDNRYGWTNIRNAEIVRTRDGGYIIKMPRPIPID